VSHTLANFGSIMKMIFILLDLPYLNHFDATASLPRDAFSERPNFSRIAFGPSTSGCSIRSSVQTVRSPLQLERVAGITSD